MQSLSSVAQTGGPAGDPDGGRRPWGVLHSCDDGDTERALKQIKPGGGHPRPSSGRGRSGCSYRRARRTGGDSKYSTLHISGFGAEARRLRRRQQAKGTPADIVYKCPVDSGVVVGAEANDADRPGKAGKAAQARSCPGSAAGRERGRDGVGWQADAGGDGVAFER